MTKQGRDKARPLMMLEHISDYLKSDYVQLVNACDSLAQRETASALQSVIEATKRLQEKKAHWLADPPLRNALARMKKLDSNSASVRRLTMWIEANAKEMDEPSERFKELWRHVADAPLPMKESTPTKSTKTKQSDSEIPARVDKHYWAIATDIASRRTLKVEAVYDDLMRAGRRARELLATSAIEADRPFGLRRHVSRGQFTTAGIPISFATIETFKTLGEIQLIGQGKLVQVIVRDDSPGLGWGIPKRLGRRGKTRNAKTEKRTHGWAWIILSKVGRIEINTVDHSMALMPGIELKFVASPRQGFVQVTSRRPDRDKKTDTGTFGPEK